jgi:hypothetical protein
VEGSDQGASQLRWALEHSTAVLGLIGLAVYGVVRFGIDAFYSRLGVTADEVGLTYGAILSRAALGLLIALIGTLALGTLSTIQFIAGYYFARVSVDTQRRTHDEQLASEAQKRQETPPRYPNRSTRLDARQIAPFWFVITLIALPAAILAALGWVLTSAELQELRLGQRTLFIISPAYTIVGAAAAWLYAIRAHQPARSNRRTWPGAGAKIGIAGLVLVILGLALLMSNWAGTRAAKEVEAGRPITRSEGFSLTWIFDVEATCVKLAPVKAPSASGTVPAPSTSNTVPSPALYLGRSGTTVILYSKGTGPVRVPGGDYVITGTDDDPCGG